MLLSAKVLRPLPDSLQCTRAPFQALHIPNMMHLKYENHLELVRGLPPRWKLIPASWVDRMSNGEDAPEFDQAFCLNYLRRSALESFCRSAHWPKMKELNIFLESALESVQGLDLQHFESLDIRDFLEHAYAPPELPLTGVREIRCNGQIKNLEKILERYQLADKLESLSLRGGLKKACHFVFEEGVLPALRSLTLNLMLKPDRLIPLLETEAFPRLEELDICGNILHPDVAAALKERPYYSGLRVLRIGGQQISAPTVQSFVDHRFDRLETLDTRNSRTYAGLGKAPPAPKIMKALARTSHPLPVRNLIVDHTNDLAALKALVTSEAFPLLERLYLTAQDTFASDYAYSMASLGDFMAVRQSALRDSEKPEGFDALRALQPLAERGVEIYLVS